MVDRCSFVCHVYVLEPTASSSSMKIIQPFFDYRADLKMFLILLGPTPTKISSNYEPEHAINGNSASLAIILASIVLPVPGGPYKTIPLLNLIPISLYFCGCLMKSIVSFNADFIFSPP